MEDLMYLNIRFAETDRDLDLDLKDNDGLSILYYPSKSFEEESTSLISFRKLFDLIHDNTKAESLNRLLEFERERVQKMEEENRELRSEIDILKSAFRSVYRD